MKNIKSRIKALEKVLTSRRIEQDNNPPPERKNYYRTDGFLDRQAYMAAVNEWSFSVSGKSLHEVAEDIAEDEGFWVCNVSSAESIPPVKVLWADKTVRVLATPGFRTYFRK